MTDSDTVITSELRFEVKYASEDRDVEGHGDHGAGRGETETGKVLFMVTTLRCFYHGIERPEVAEFFAEEARGLGVRARQCSEENSSSADNQKKDSATQAGPLPCQNGSAFTDGDGV